MNTIEVNKYIVNNVFVFNDSNSHYGLKVLFEFDNGFYLYFDSFQFVLETNNSIMFRHQWEKTKYNIPGNLTIRNIRDDEVNHYTLFSHGLIFYIYQTIDGNEFWSQEFEMIDIRDDVNRYAEVYAVMHEDWVQDSVIMVTPPC